MAKPPKKNFSGKPGKPAGNRAFERGKGGKPQRREEGRKDFSHPDKRDERPRRFEERPAAPKTPRLKADLFGFHAVREAWKNPARFVHALYLTEGAIKDFEGDLKTAAKRPGPTIVTKEELDKAFPPGTVHQGIALSCQPLAETSVIDIVIKAEAKPKSVIVMLDQVTDPHNIGAILRSACAFGADGVVMQSKHAPEMTGILAKTACGALEHIPVAYETNLSRALEKLQEHHYTVIGLDEHSEKTFGDLYKYERVVIVLGAEGPGLRRLIREHCDVLVKLPTNPPIASLNVSNAAAVALYALTA
ncbi:MAG TPA: 23S rRNA (guanosine(2251)-2'-O)-methyltransferase RlmB [Micavibrio sp.]|nr:23S rRNA (guanosine(2251)-2'-O)-methyltransferase RlmB [Micavibrio sp.]